MSFILSFEIIKVVDPDPRMFLFIAASAAEAAAVSPSIPKGLITLKLIMPILTLIRVRKILEIHVFAF